MKFGCSLIVRGPDATQENLRTMATQAEAWGFDSLWASDHIILPPLETPSYPGSATGQFSLKVRLRFGTGADPQPPLHGSPDEVLAAIQAHQALGVQHLVLDFAPETINNALTTLEHFVCEVRPALA